MTSTATEVMIRLAEHRRRTAPFLARFQQMFVAMLAEHVKLALKRRRKSKGYRKHVRRMKAAEK